MRLTYGAQVTQPPASTVQGSSVPAAPGLEASAGTSTPNPLDVVITDISHRRLCRLPRRLLRVSVAVADEAFERQDFPHGGIERRPV